MAATGAITLSIGGSALGADVKGLWLVDFDTGAGYYCWKWPEEELAYFHGYEEGFAGRARTSGAEKGALLGRAALHRSTGLRLRIALRPAERGTIVHYQVRPFLGAILVCGLLVGVFAFQVEPS